MGGGNHWLPVCYSFYMGYTDGVEFGADTTTCEWEVLGHSGWTRTRSSPIPRTIGQSLARIGFDFQGWIRDREAAFADRTGTQHIADLKHAILVSATAGRSVRDLEFHIAELRELAHSTGATSSDVGTQNRPRVDPKTVLGPKTGRVACPHSHPTSLCRLLARAKGMLWTDRAALYTRQSARLSHLERQGSDSEPLTARSRLRDTSIVRRWEKERPRAAPGHPGSADPADARNRLAARLRHRPPREDGLRRRIAGRREFAVSGPAAAPAQRVGRGRLGHVREQPPRSVLHLDRRRPAAVGAQARRVRPHHLRHPPRPRRNVGGRA